MPEYGARTCDILILAHLALHVVKYMLGIHYLTAILL